MQKIIGLLFFGIFFPVNHVQAIGIPQRQDTQWTNSAFFDVSDSTLGSTITVKAGFRESSCVPPINPAYTTPPVVGFRLIAAGGNPKGGAVDIRTGTMSVTRNGQLLAGTTIIPDYTIFGVSDIFFRFSQPFFYANTDSITLTVTNAKVKEAGEATFTIESLHQPTENEITWAKQGGRDIWFSGGSCPGASSLALYFGGTAGKPTNTAPTTTPVPSVISIPSSTPMITPIQPKTVQPQGIMNPISLVISYIGSLLRSLFSSR